MYCYRKNDGHAAACICVECGRSEGQPYVIEGDQLLLQTEANITDRKSYDLFSRHYADSERSQKACELHSVCWSSRRLTLRKSCFTYC
jgi:hypothetical protein